MNQRKNSNVTDILANARWILPVVLWIILTFFSYEYILKAEERSLFIYESFWLKDFLHQPSGILSCCGLFLTQFLHMPWLGSLIWVVLLAATAELTRVVYRGSMSALTYIPAAIFVACNMSMGYIVYLMNLPGYFFMPTLGYLWALLTVAVLRKAGNTAVSIILNIIWGVAGYYIAGFYSLAGLAAACVDVMFSSRNRSQRMLFLTGAAIPLLLAPILFSGATTYNLSDGWTIGLPEVANGLTFWRIQLPLMLAMIIPVLAPLSRFLDRISGKKAILITQSVALAAVIAVPASVWTRDEHLKAELGMIRAVDNLQWNKAISVFQDIQDRNEDNPAWEPTRAMVLLKDLALIKTGQEGERAFSFEDGSMSQKGRWNVSMSFQVGKQLYLHYGIPGICNRWCGEESVIFGQSYNTLKYYAMVAMVLDDTVLAEKYLRKLAHTLFYGKWAKEQIRLCHNKSQIATTAPYDMILPLMCYDDVVSSNIEGCEMYITNHFNGPSPQNSTALYDRVTLFYALKSKQTTLFLTRLYLYLDSNKPKEIARHYQEFAYLLSNSSHIDALQSLPYNETVKSYYKSFGQYVSRTGNKSLGESKAAFPASLRHTYYFYYYCVNELAIF